MCSAPRFSLVTLVLSVTLLLFASVASANPAPAFKATDITGKSHSLADFKGKIVVLEWFNPGCPYVKKHYETKNMQGLQERYTAKGVVWLTVNSSAPGKQGYMSNEEAAAKIQEWGIKATAALVDSEGTIGRAYDAKTTPHMYIVDANGTLVYQGAIDDNDSSSKSSVAGAKNYVVAALDELLAGKAVTTSSSVPYGCSVKYRK